VKIELVYGKEQSKHSLKVVHHLLEVLMAELGLNPTAMVPWCVLLTTMHASCAGIIFPQQRYLIAQIFSSSKRASDWCQNRQSRGNEDGVMNANLRGMSL